MSIKVGVLSLQGAFKEHISRLKECGISAAEVKFPEQFKDIDGLIIPGGESTTINKLQLLNNLWKSIRYLLCMQAQRCR